MHFSENDVAYLMRTSSYLRLMNIGGATRFIGRQLELGSDCREALSHYPDLQIEPLEFYYTCLYNLGTMGRPLIADMLAAFNWRGAVWASWLCLLRPSLELAAPLLEARDCWPHNAWLIDVAIAECRGDAVSALNQALGAFGDVARQFRALLAPLPTPATPMRLAPTEAQLLQLSQERERIRRCYHAQGSAAAHAMLRGSPYEIAIMSHRDWRCFIGKEGGR